MSLGAGIGEIGLLVKLAKDTVSRCRNAPSDFAEASRVCQSLYLMLEAVQSEADNPDSPLYKDDRTRTDFAIHLRNCKLALHPLANLVNKHTNLGTSKVSIIGRLKFSKREYLEYRGNLSFYTAKLSEFLQMVGLGSLGRIEQKVEHIKENLPKLMSKIDQMVADLRLNGDKQSLLSDHTDDEKFVWKVFRRKLNDAGFTSNVLREHEQEIFLRIRELTECGLLVADASSAAMFDHTDPIIDTDLRKDDLTVDTADKASTDDSAVTSADRTSNQYAFSEVLPKTRKIKSHTDEYPVSDDTQSQCVSNETRIWRNLEGKVILKGRLAQEAFRGGRSFIAVLDEDNEEVLIPCSNLGSDDLAFAEKMSTRVDHEPIPQHVINDMQPRFFGSEVNVAEDVDDTVKRTKDRVPKRKHGKRRHITPQWEYRRPGSCLPQRPVMVSRGQLLSDALPQAAARGDLKTVKQLLSAGYHIESKGPQSWTQTDTSSDPPTTTRYSYPETTALYRAAHAGWLDVVRHLLESGANVNTRDGYDGKVGDPILFTVVRAGDDRMTRLLLEYEAEIASRNFGPATALHIASSYPRRTLVKLLLDFNAYIDAKDDLGRTPLYWATISGRSGGFVRNVELLLKEGAKPNIIANDGQTALYKACGRGRDDIVELLLQYGADPHLGRGRHGETALFRAAWSDNAEVVEMLLLYGQNVDQQNDRKMKSYRGVGEKLLHGVLSAVSKEHAIMNNWGRTALHAAAYQGNKDITELLLQAEADPEIHGNDGMTPLYVAAERHQEEVVQMLLNAGAKLNASSDPVLALIEKKNRRKRSDEKSVQPTGMKGQMERIGTDDQFVGLVASVAKSLANSRRGDASGFAANMFKLYVPTTKSVDSQRRR